MSSNDTQPPLSMDILVQRQLQAISTGNDAYLETFLKVARRAGFRIRVIFAPCHSFGNKPWTRIHPRLGALIDEIVWPGAMRSGQTYWTVSPRVWWRFAKRLIIAMRMRLGEEIQVKSYLGRPLPEHEKRAIANVVNAAPGRVTLAEYSSMGPVLDLVTAPTRKGVFSHDVLSDRVIRIRATGRELEFYPVTPEEELAWCRMCDFMVYASNNERESFGSRLGDLPSTWLRPEPEDYGDVPAGKGPSRIVFIGTTHIGNTDALHHFVDDIWPLVVARKPDLEFWVAGSAGKTLSAEQAGQRGIKVLGRVEDLRDVGGPYSIGVAPTRLATGISIKVAEYLMLDMPVMAYPLALEGFGAVLDDLVEVADTPEDFAERLIAMSEQDAAPAETVRQKKAAAQAALSNAEVEAFLKDL